jgi:hypothetical protein
MTRWRAICLGAGLAGFVIAWTSPPPHHAAAARRSVQDSTSTPNALRGWVRSINGMEVIVESRTGRLVRVDASPAMQAGHTGVLHRDQPVMALGQTDSRGVLHAITVQRLKGSPDTWPPDR